jgi:hypothetical protein
MIAVRDRLILNSGTLFRLVSMKQEDELRAIVVPGAISLGL